MTPALSEWVEFNAPPDTIKVISEAENSFSHWFTLQTIKYTFIIVHHLERNRDFLDPALILFSLVLHSRFFFHLLLQFRRHRSFKYTAIHDVTNHVTHRIFNIDSWYFSDSRTFNFDENSSFIGVFWTICLLFGHGLYFVWPPCRLASEEIVIFTSWNFSAIGNEVHAVIWHR